ncbi:hypothetical protein [Azospirillum argentinense]
MVKVTRLGDILAEAIGWDVGEVRHYSRRAREGGELTSTGARGNAAPDATPRDAASLIMAVLGATYAKDAAIVIQQCRAYGKANGTFRVPDIAKVPESADGEFIEKHNALRYKEGEVSKGIYVYRLPKEYQWMLGADTFGDALDGLMNMAASGVMRDVSGRTCDLYSFPTVSVEIGDYGGSQYGKVTISDVWENTVKYSELSGKMGVELNDFIVMNIRPLPLFEVMYFRNSIHNVKREDGDARKKFTVQPELNSRKAITQGVLEVLGEALRR